MAFQKKEPSKCIIKNNIVEIELVNSEKIAICDLKDFDLVNKRRWTILQKTMKTVYITIQ